MSASSKKSWEVKKDRQSGDEATRVGCSSTEGGLLDQDQGRPSLLDQQVSYINAEVDEELLYIHCRNITWEMEGGLFEGYWKWMETGISTAMSFYQQVDDLITTALWDCSHFSVHEAQPCGGLVGGEQST